MPTINLGRIGFVSKGTYNSSTSYKVNDVVTYNNKVYACIQATSNNVPTNTTYWVNWIGDTNASNVIVTPTGGISSTDAQSALAELDTEKAAKATTLSGYGITDATPSSHIGSNGTSHAVATTSLDGFMSYTDKSKLDNISAATTTPLMDGTGSIGSSTKYAKEDHTHPSDTSRLSNTQTLAITGDVTASSTALNTGTIITTLANSGVTAGTYKSVTVDVKGRVTTGSNPTTLSGYGITDAVTKDSSTGAASIPSGTTAQRPASPATGYMRYNTTIGKAEMWNGTMWSSVSSGATGGGSDSVFYENDQVVTTNYTITTGKNAMSAGPITVADGVTVTVPSSSVWTIV